MQNIASIYRFNTPFLDIPKEKGSLLRVLEKIKTTIKLDGIYFQESNCKSNVFTQNKITLENNLGEFIFYYINDLDVFLSGNHHLPLFRVEIFLDDKFIYTETYKKKAVDFMESIFECFDGLNEKEFLIDLHPELFYKKSFLSRKKLPHYDFSDIFQIQKDFESKNGMKILEDFIVRFSLQPFELCRETAEYYHKIHGIMLYFMYLVYMISNTLDKKEETSLLLESVENNGNIELMKKRLDFVHDLNHVTFSQYKKRLVMFFKLFG